MEKQRKEFIRTLFVGIAGAVVLGVVSIFEGVYFGGNRGNILLGSFTEYEAGGYLFGIIGASVGSLVAIIISRKIPLLSLR